MRDDETTIKGNLATVIVRNDHGPYPERNRGQLYLELEGAKLTGLDANELRDAIDKAVGPREAAAPSLEERIEALEKVPADYEVVLDPPLLLDTLSTKARHIPAIQVERITTHADGVGGLDFRLHDDGGFIWYSLAQQALELGVTAEDFGPSVEASRKEYEDKGLADWEIELLLGA